MGHPEWAEDVRFHDVMARYKNYPALLAQLETWTMQHTSVECEEILTAASVPCVRYRTIAEALEDPLFAERGAFPTVTDPAGDYLISNLPFKMSGPKPQPFLLCQRLVLTRCPTSSNQTHLTRKKPALSQRGPFNWEGLSIEVSSSLPVEPIIRGMNNIIEGRDKSKTIRVDNAPEYTSCGDGCQMRCLNTHSNGFELFRWQFRAGRDA